MKTKLLLLIPSMLFFTGCGLFGGGEEASVTPPPPPPPPPEETETPVTTNFNQPPVGLIPPITPQQRLPQISKGRRDPFDVITTIPSSGSTTGNNLNGNSALGESGSPSGRNSRGSNNGTGFSPSGNGQLTSDGKTIIDMGKIVPPSPPAPPPPPVDAEKVSFSGIINSQGTNIALVQVPWENTIRQVRVGDVLSDGTVTIRVRDIRFASPTNIAVEDNGQLVNVGIKETPIIILEQFGQRVTKELGNKPSDNIS